MTLPQLATTDMFAAVKATIDAHNAAWATYVPFANGCEKFSGLLEGLDGIVGLQATKSVGTTGAKEALRSSLEGQAHHIISTLVLHFKATGKPQDERDVYMSKSELHKISERAFIGHVSKVIAKAGDITPATLTALGLDPAEFAAAANNLNSFIAAKGTPRHIVAEAKRGTQELDATIEAMKDVLMDEMDPAAEVLQYSKPEFYSEYKTAREIIDAGYRTRELTVKVTTGEGTPIKGVQALITDGDIHKVTGATGLFYINNMEGGTYNMLLTANGYENKTVPFTIVDNQPTVVTVTLAAKP